MPLQVNVEIKGLDKIKETLQKYPQEAKKNFGEAVYTSAQILATQIRVSQRTPVDTGTMINKTGATKTGPLSAETYVATDYAVVVHQGIAKDIELPKANSVFIPGVGWRKIKVIKARAPRPFVDWALQDGAQLKIDITMEKALEKTLASAAHD